MFDPKDERYKSAKKRAGQLREFYQHLGSYLFVNTIIFTIDVLDGGSWWFYWVLVPWGLGILSHGWSIFGGNRFGKDWEERKIRQIMEQEEGVKPKRSLAAEDDYFENQSDAR
jgi:hypothetical protein